MSLSVVFHGATDGDDGPFSLSSASGWELFGHWAELLPETFSAVKALSDEGEYQGTDQLARQLKVAVRDYSPERPLRHTIEGLLELLGVGDPEEFAVVTDGDSDDEDEDFAEESYDELEADNDPQATAELIAEILYGLYGDDALESFAQDSEDNSQVSMAEPWNPMAHPRGPNGRFIARGSAEAVSAAKEVISKVLKGEKPSGSAEKVAEHLAILTVKQLKSLHKEHGQKPPAGLRKQLVDAVLARLPNQGDDPHKIVEVKTPGSKWFGSSYKVGDKILPTRQSAEEYVKDLKTGRSPASGQEWLDMDSQAKYDWASRNVDGWHTKSPREQNRWFADAIQTAADKVKADQEKKAREEEEAQRKEKADRDAREKEAYKAARTYKPKGDYKEAEFTISLGDGKSEKVSGIGNAGLFAHKDGGQWKISHTPSGLKMGDGYPSKGAAMLAMDRLASLTDFTKPSSELLKSGVSMMIDIRDALDLSKPLPEGASRPAKEEKTPETKPKTAAVSQLESAISTRPVHDLADLREASPDLPGRAFDDAILALADAGKVVLSVDVDTSVMDPAKKKTFVTDGHRVYTTVSPRESKPASTPSPEAIWPKAQQVAQTLEEKARAQGKAMEIPEFTDAMVRETGLSRADVHKLLQQWQSEDKLTLQLANDRHLIKRPGDGIETPRGLRYYIQMKPTDPPKKPTTEPASKPIAKTKKQQKSPEEPASKPASISSPEDEAAAARAEVDAAVKEIEAYKSQFTGERWKKAVPGVSDRINRSMGELKSRFDRLRKTLTEPQAKAFAKAFGKVRKFKTGEEAIREVERDLTSRLGWTGREYA